MIKIDKHQVYSTDGKLIHRLGDETYFHRATVLNSDTADNFEEIEEAPRMTRREYETRVVELIRKRYTADEERALSRKMLAVMLHPQEVDNDSDRDTAVILAEFDEYDKYVEECKQQAKAV